jgi:hypothetical protein
MSDTKGHSITSIDDILGISGGHQSSKVTQRSVTDQKYFTSLKDLIQNVTDFEKQKKYLDTFTESKSTKAQKIIRTHFVSKMIPLMQWISQHHTPRKPTVAVHMAKFLELSLKLFKENTNDPFSSYAVALYDGLSYNDTWLQLEREFYSKLNTQLIAISKKEYSDYRDIDKEIIKLETLGLNTTPY